MSINAESLVELTARAIAAGHFARKKHVGACFASERIKYLVDKYWRTFTPDAQIVLVALRSVASE